MSLTPAILRMLSDLHRVRQHRASSGAPIPSSTGKAIEAARTGIVGDGNSARYPAQQEPHKLVPAPEVCRRLAALDKRDGRIVRKYLVESVEVQDLSSDPPRVLGLDLRRPDGRKHAVSLTLAQRIGWVTADEAQQAKWTAAILRGDSRPALLGMDDRGTARLALAAAEWDSDGQTEVTT